MTRPGIYEKTPLSMPRTALITAAREDVESFLAVPAAQKVEIQHLPLEVYVPRKGDTEIGKVLDKLDAFENIVHSNRRNARFFLEEVRRRKKLEALTSRLNLAVDEETFAYLEQQGVAAVYPQNGSKPIDLIELMLRLKRLDATLYPCGSHQREDFPGFLKELDIPVTELDVFDLEGPSREELDGYRQQLQENPPQTVVFHSRRSVNRTLAAFPDLDYGALQVISADRGISQKLEDRDIGVDAEAEGSWDSIAGML